MSISLLPCHDPLANYKGCMEAEDDNDVRENASSGESKSSAATSPCHQFPLFSISNENAN